MTPRARPTRAHAAVAAAAILLSACGGSAPQQAPAPAADSEGPRIVQPGAPGEDGSAFDPAGIGRIEGTEHTGADARFMQGMIPHHGQALQMTALVPDRTSDPGFRRMALRMEISQRDEIELMERWLRERGEPVALPMTGGMDMTRGMAMMPGMLSEAQMAELEAASGQDFERLFLEFMIMHHEGAITMVQRLFASPGAGQETQIGLFASHVDADQTIEIQRMRQMLDVMR